MIVNLKLDAKTSEALTAMAEDSTLTPEFLVEVAVYNLIALWMRDRGINVEADAPVDAGVDVSISGL